MKLIRILVVMLVAGFAAMSAHATTVIAPTFDQLVSQADLIFQGTVTEVRSQWVGAGPDRHIASFVTFRIDDSMKGEPGSSYTLEMMGGTVDGRTMEVSDAPRFKAGDRDILFVEHNGTQFIPLVGIMHGRFHVQQAEPNGPEFISKDNGAPLADLTKLGKDETAATSGKALSTADFKSAIRQKLAATR